MTKREAAIAAILAAADGNTSKMKAAFLAAIDELRLNLVDSVALEAALAVGDIEAAIAATHIDDLENLFFGIGMSNNAYVLNDEMIRVFGIGAATALSNLPEALQKALSFNLLNERAVNIMRREGADMISNLTASSKAGVRAIMERSIADGRNPVKQVQEVRQLIGLTPNSAQAVFNFRRQLEEQRTLGFKAPGDRRLSAIERSVVNRHMKEGHLTDAQIDSMVERYFQSLLNKRAKDVARTEALNAINNGQLEMWEQARDAGYLDDEEDRMFWIVTHDDKLRATHAAIPGMNPYGVKIGSLFLTPFGLVRGPGDRNVNLINCRCVLVIGRFGETIT